MTEQLITEARALFRRLQREYTGLYYSNLPSRRVGLIKYRAYRRLMRRQGKEAQTK